MPECPEAPVNLTCKVLRKRSAQWKIVGSASAPNEIVLNEYDPDGCYNIFCETSDDIDSMFIEWTGTFITSGPVGYRKSLKPPFYLSGQAGGGGCSILGDTCEDLDITIMSRRNKSPGSNVTSPYTCAGMEVRCEPLSCYKCLGDLFSENACPNGPADCRCPARTKVSPTSPQKCDPCITCSGDLIPNDNIEVCPVRSDECQCPGDLEPSFDGSDICTCPAGTKVSPTSSQTCDPCITCSGDLIPKSDIGVCPVKSDECQCPGDLKPTFAGSNICTCPAGTKVSPTSSQTCDPCITCGGDLIPKTGIAVCPVSRANDCTCPANEVLVAENTCEPCRQGFYFKDGMCVSVCPAGRKLDPSGYCVLEWCNANFQCPANSKRGLNKECYDTVTDCECNTGYTMINGQCITCPFGKKPDASGFCVMDWCYDNYICPANSYRTSNRDCYNNIDDCTCNNGYYKSFGYCRSWWWW